MAKPQKGDQVRATTYMLISLVLAGVVASGCGGGGRRVVQNGEELSINQDKFLKAVELQRKEDYFKALKAWDEVIKDEPRYGLAHFNKALCYDRINYVAEAMGEYELARKYDPKNSIILMNLGEVYLRADNRLASAFDALREAAEIDPYRPGIHFNLSAAYMRAREWDKALTHADIAVDLVAVPSKTSENGLDKSVDLRQLSVYLLRQAECHIERGEMDKAKACLDRVEKQCHETVPVKLSARVTDAAETPPKG